MLDAATEFGTPAGKNRGTFMWEYYKHTGGRIEMTRRMFGVKSGEYKSGVLFNFCPFCGERIDAPFAEQKDDPDGSTA